MKLFFSLFTLCILIIVSTQSCQKDTESPATIRDTVIISHLDTIYHSDTIYVKQPKSILGLWIGLYSVVKGPVSGNSNLYYSYELHSDSTIQMMGIGGAGQTNYGLGTWSLKGTAFSAHIVTTNLSDAGTAQTVVGVYDSTNNILSGTFTDDGLSPNTFQASYRLEKVR